MSVLQRLKELFIESAVYGLPFILQRFIGLLTIPVFTRILLPADYGVMGMMSSVSSFLGIFVVLGLDSAVGFYYYDTEDGTDRRSTITTWIYFYLSISSLLVCGLWLASSELAGRFLGSVNNADIVKYVAVTMWLTSFWSISWNVLRIQRKKWTVIALVTFNTLLTTLLNVLFVVVFKQGIRGLYLGSLLAAIPYFLINLWLLRSWLRPKWLSGQRLKEMLAYGIPLVPAGLAYWTIGLIDRFFLEHYRGLSDVGIFTIATSLSAAIMMLVSSFQQAWGPFAISIKMESTSKEVYAKTLSYYLVLTSGAAVFLSVFAHEILSVLTPKAYHAAGPVVAYLSFASIGYGAYYIASIGTNLVKKTAHIGWTTMVSAALLVALNYLLVPRLGMVGAGISAMVAHWSSAVLLFIISQRYYPIPYRWGEVSIVLITSALVITVGTQISTGTLWSSIVLKLLCLACYPGVILLTGIVDPKQVRFLSRQLSQRVKPSFVRA